MTGRPAPVVLPPSLRVGLGLVAAFAALVVVVLGIRYAGEGGPGTVDVRIRELVEGTGPSWRYVALAMDALGEPVGAATLVVPAVTSCLLFGRPRAAVFVVAGVGISVGSTEVLKHVVGRTIHGGHLSYPSGHTAFATALALVVAMLANRRRGRDGVGLGGTARTVLVLAAALVAGAVMGWAQVALSAHYPTDVLGGWCTALAVVPATAWLVDRMAGVGRRECRRGQVRSGEVRPGGGTRV
ncbi:phosphatase PAP2 family protein [Kitasatospora paracochleata]|uniref:Undecaprenyl-diphosphatase n=1 Tax=Kitasatospora paracochleata TaxID=58354 RepID=A0ABT1JAY6_9ACTN|nr:phosphatase PAP2 family protein [Kitasatospora paracochleata]MCP2314615.1 undecaprenyl-diphosphatase [Kitasatospora paracochleata]